MEQERAQHEADQSLRIDLENAQHVKDVALIEVDILYLKAKLFSQHLNICDLKDVEDLNSLNNLLTQAAFTAQRIAGRSISDRPRG